MKRMRDLAHFSCEMRVWRGGAWWRIDSGDAVPGDIFEVTPATLPQLPCDAFLLDGDCIVNESMLTGESVPVSKTSANDEDLASIDYESNDPIKSNEISRYFLFGGTKVIRSRAGKFGNGNNDDGDENDIGANGCLAMVARDSFRFIGVLGIIASLGFLASFYNFIMLKVDPVMIFVRALDLITIVIPPALPATMTEDGLDVLGFRETTKDINSMSSENDRVSLNEFSKLYKTATLLENKNSEFPYPLIICAMGVCHSIKVVNGQVMGDPMDLKMFEFTNWNIDELDASSKITTDQRVRLKKMSLQNVVGTIVSPPYDKTFPESNIFTEFGVIKSFEFVSGLRRMSVIVRRISYIKETFTFQAKVKQPDLTNKMNTSTGKDFEIFVKGAPEVIKDICLKDSIPFNYDELLRHYAHSGYRVIAFAYKKLVNISFLKIMKAKRGDVEKELTFLGFIIFENKLKAGTADIVKILNQAKIRQVMCTGDNVLTAVSVSRICDLVNIQNKIFIPSIAEREIHRNENSKIIWEDIEGSNIFLDPKTLLPPFPSRSSNFENSPIPFKYDLAVTGDIFQHILDYGSEDLLNKVLIKCQIFARMSPEQKHLLVEHLQALGCCVGFCGDGANDCGALKAADVGISLSEAEASVAAPFTSQVTHIECVPTLIREGRAALVTSFSCFKYM
ncbi:hypothetical protein HK099_002735 [Clydaea vesicula]|uniref:P-type ATPase A domain-containing protein n=1 Tax=Clydaea vesicula TaxID=447962 RepID=A0AAD5U580_9FUNG|nr:hypothetical protein HK099_002735 [Clydaea vesicula]